MSQYRHGVYIEEMATQLVTPNMAESALPVVVGTAPVHRLTGTPPPVNEPRLIYNMPQFTAQFGVPGAGDNPEDYTLHQMASAYFSRYKASPVVFVNVFDPARHTKVNPDWVSEEESPDVPQTLPDVQAVTEADIIGGTDDSCHRTGLALIEEVFPRFRLTPGLIMAPRWSGDPTVARAIESSCTGISGFFRACGLIEIPDSVTRYTDAPAWLNDNNLCDASGNTFAMYGHGLYGGHVEPGSIHLAGCIGGRDSTTESIPYWSPSNYQIEAEGLVHHGEELHLTPAEAAYLNSQGIVTGLNMIGGLRCWGDQTTACPGVTDPKEASIPIRRMFTWIGNTLILTCWQYVSSPIRKRMLETVQDTVNYFLNGLVGRGYLLGGRCDFEQADNPTQDLLDGKVRWHLYIAPPQAGRELTFILEYDPAYLDTLFGSTEAIA